MVGEVNAVQSANTGCSNYDIMRVGHTIPARGSASWKPCLPGSQLLCSSKDYIQSVLFLVACFQDAGGASGFWSGSHFEGGGVSDNRQETIGEGQLARPLPETQ